MIVVFIPPTHIMVVILHFMPEAANNVRSMGKPGSGYLTLGADRLRAGLGEVHPGSGNWDGWSSDKDIGDIVVDGEYLEPRGTVSFLLAAMICRKASNPRLTGKFAYTEALYAIYALGGTNIIQPSEKPPDVDPVCELLLGERPERDGGDFLLPIPTYLSLAVGLGKSWKLVNQTVHGGSVVVDRDTLLRLLRDAITAYIRQRIVAMPEPPVEVPRDLVEWCERRATVNVSGDVPPCVEECRDMMDGGGNLAHAGRYLVGTYFINDGLEDEQIGEMFVGAPDYNAKITLYQVRQLRSRGYKVPSCRWVASNGLCPGCDATHPTKFKKQAT